MTNQHQTKRIAILGAGPIGIEAALYARNLGYETTVFEAGRIGNHIRAWGHVELFTPWALNISPLGNRRLSEKAGFSPNLEVCSTGHELVEAYLDPLCSLPEMKGVVREHTRVVSIGRGTLLKGDGVGGGRDGTPFRILLENEQGEQTAEADVVIDATGVYGQPNALGEGGVPSLGERELINQVDCGVPDVVGLDRPRFTGKRVLLVGGGFSAATTLRSLSGLPGTQTFWATRTGHPPITEIPDDPLPTRLKLAREANQLADGSNPAVHHLACTTVSGLASQDGVFMVKLNGTAGSRVLEVDRVIAQTGFHPDNTLYRELQIHECYASEGPMKLSASLLGAGSGDCMTQESFGPASLTSPEPSFYIVGNKSYGRNPHFLLRIGRDQVRDVFRLISEEETTNLYESEGAGV